MFRHDDTLSIGGFVAPPPTRHHIRRHRRRTPASFLSGVDLFHDVEARDVKRLEDLFTLVDVPAGRELMTQGARGRQFACLVHGTVDIERDGAQIDRFRRGTYFGEIALLPEISTDGLRRATVTAATRSRIAVCDLREFRTMVDRRPDLRATMAARAATLID